MYSIQFLLTLLLTLLPLASSRAVFTSTGYAITTLSSAVRTNTTQTTLMFSVHDSEPVADETTSCGAAWTRLSGFPSNWVRCSNPAFSFYLSKFNSTSTFALEIKHSFKDPSLGDPPFDSATTFARLTVNPTDVVCKNGECAMPAGQQMKAPVWAASG
ncbi:hypothetical protein EJ06DRAFT_551962 [Trichodelitschia bisporula]|uniref:AA1-like domain-containing protein n=1 Tax=Trichodelitschia bisporula TaxID=703511 RepID=A0A6G1HJD1_9PEZI|nr:hypothetical protein EJ06DRAFT_551962 [Trichodelitschia bisporula]